MSKDSRFFISVTMKTVGFLSCVYWAITTNNTGFNLLSLGLGLMLIAWYVKK